MDQTAPDPIACALFLLVAFVCAGFAQTAWFRSPRSKAFAAPLDGGYTWRGRRLFGANKTVRGFVVMIPAAAVVFMTCALAAGEPQAAGLWALSPTGYAALGAWAGFGFMAGELPNSFVKRQLDIAPGAATGSRTGSIVQFIGDRIDSGVGMLAALAIVVPTPALTWAIVLLAGPPLHWGFSLLMFHLGLKARPA